MVSEISFAAMMLLAIVSGVKDKLNRPLITLIVASIIIPVLVFIPYKMNFSEYYLMMTLPPFILLIGYFLSKLSKKVFTAMLVVIALFTLLNLKDIIAYNRPMSLGAKEAAVKFIIEKAGRSGYGLSLTTAPGYTFGFRYILKYYNATPDFPPKKDQKKIMTLVIPPGFDGIKSLKEYDGIGILWEGIE
jgi:hypothetical protein